MNNNNLRTIGDTILYGIALLIFCSTVGSAIASETELFKVLVSKGTVFVQLNKGEWLPLPSGTKIFDGETVKIGDNSLLSLVTTAGKAVEIKSAGLYPSSELIKQATKGSSLTKRFAGYVANELTRPDESGVNQENYKANMRTTGGVERANDSPVNVFDRTKELAKLGLVDGQETGISEQQTISGSMIPIMPLATDIIDDIIQFSWQKKQGVELTLLSIRDASHNSIYQKETDKTFMNLSVTTLKLEKNSCYFWSVTSVANPDDKSEEYSICTIPDDKREAVSDTVKMIEQESPNNGNSVIGKLMLAVFYEQQNLMQRALKCYREALKIAPESDDVILNFYHFRKRIGMPD
ncbi:MAG: hypothetical protein HYZ44_05555 [Bacteroidetes bacterium]|nr:hypothetical protein [Bacteroidota bacterium]